MIREAVSELSIATFNTFGAPIFSPSPRKRYETFSSMLNAMDIDVLNLQEVHTYRLLRTLRKRLHTFPYVVYERSLLGAKGGLVTFSRHPIEKVEYTSFAKPNDYHPRSLFEALDLRDKGVLAGKLHGAPIAIINTHLTANMDNDWSRRSRYYKVHQAELEQLGILIDRIQDPGYTVVTTGDFNIAKGSELYQRFVSGLQIQDVFSEDMRPTYHTQFMPRGEQPHCIDYIFYSAKSNSIDIKQTSLLFQDKARLPNGQELFLSDHIGLLARLAISSI